MNEAELQNLTASVLKTVLPTFNPVDIKCQGQFSIKFGHHNVLVDGKEPGKYANRSIYDLLVYIKEKPVILLELKKPGLKISPEDVKQGISYARLTDSITPITLISNGTENQFYNTITTDRIDVKMLDNTIIDSIDSSLKRAGQDILESLTSVMANDQGVFFQIINTISATTFKDLKGTHQEFNKPLIDNFCVERDALVTLTETIQRHKFAFLTGSAFTGKTTLAYQYFNQESANKNAVLYINSQQTFYSIFRKIATAISAECGHYINEERIREWLLFYAKLNSTLSFTVIFDAYTNSSTTLVKEHIHELIDLFSINGQRIIIVSDSAISEHIIKDPDRNSQTIIGQKFSEVKLKEFSTFEFYRANEIVQKDLYMGIPQGGEYTWEFRIPRLWRMVIDDSGRPSQEHYGLIESIPTVGYIELFRSFAKQHPQLMPEFKLFSQVYIDGLELLKDKPDLHLMSYSMAIILASHAEEKIGLIPLQKLIDAGFIEKRLTGDFERFYLPKLPELIPPFAADYIKNIVVRELNITIEQGYRKLLQLCENIPYGELVATSVIAQLGQDGHLEHYSNIIEKLYHDRPKEEVLNPKAVYRIFDKNAGFLNVPVDASASETYYQNQFPYLVLSHLTYLYFQSTHENPNAFRLVTIAKVGNVPFILRSVDRSLFHDGIESFDFANIGSMLRTDIGLIEPITLSIKLHMLNCQKDFEDLYDFAKTEKLYNFVHRVYIAAKYTLNQASGSLVDFLIKVKTDYENEFLYKMMAIAQVGKDAGRNELRRAEKEIKKRLKKIQK